MTASIALSLAACIAVAPQSDRILARDIASAFPAIAAIDPAAEIAPAPAPGAARVFRANDLRLLAARFHIEDTAAVQPFCVARRVIPLDVSGLLAAMRRSLPDARLEILEFSHQPAPEGEIEFPLINLHAAANNVQTGFWTGDVRYAGSRRFGIWAKVKAAQLVSRVVAAVDLHPGQPIDAAQLIAQTRESFPSTARYVETIGEAAGRWPRLSIRAGSPVRVDELTAPREVMRGQTVFVEVHNGAARLAFEAVAQDSGSIGDSVFILNPESRKIFRARVEGKGRVSVNAAPTPIGGKP